MPQDAYGAQVDRPNACIDPTASIVISIVDSCPCNYPSNQYANGRWCCGDMTHFDTAYWVFQKVRKHVTAPSILHDLRWRVTATSSS